MRANDKTDTLCACGGEKPEDTGCCHLCACKAADLVDKVIVLALGLRFYSNSPCLRQRWDRAFSRGAYAEAYEQRGEVLGSLHLLRAENANPWGVALGNPWNTMWVCGFIAGYYSGYEEDEVPDEDKDLYCAAVKFAMDQFTTEDSDEDSDDLNGRR